MSVHLQPGCETFFEIWPTAVAASWKTSNASTSAGSPKNTRPETNTALENTLLEVWRFLLETIIFGCYDMLVYWSVKIISKNQPFLTKRCPSSSTSKCWVQHGSTCPGCTWYLLGGETTKPFETYAQVKLDHETPNIPGEHSKTYLSCHDTTT